MSEATPAEPGLAAALEDRGAFVERWLERFLRSGLRLPGAVDQDSVAGVARLVADDLAIALSDGSLRPGDPVLREAEKRIAFAAGALGVTSSAFDIAAFVAALRDELLDAAPVAAHAGLRALGDWFSALALESYSRSREDALRSHHHDALERVPILLLAQELPALFLVGEPDRSVLTGSFGRLLLAIVRVDARAILIDAQAVGAQTHPALLEPLAVLAQHKKVAGRVTPVVIGLSSASESAWRDVFATTPGLVLADTFEEGQARALTLAGWELTRRRAAP